MFPDLADDDEIPEIILAVHQSPDGGMYWLAGKEGMLKQVTVVPRRTAGTNWLQIKRSYT